MIDKNLPILRVSNTTLSVVKPLMKRPEYNSQDLWSHHWTCSDAIVAEAIPLTCNEPHW